MGFDSVTFVAQIVNLAILVWLLKRFLYRPIIDAVDKRQAYIHQKIQEAADEKEKWENESALLAHQQKAFETSKKEIWDNTLKEQEELRKKNQQFFNDERKRGTQQIQAELQAQKEQLTLQMQAAATQCVMTLMHRLTRDFALNSSVDNNILLFEKVLKKLSKSEREKIRALLNQGEKATLLTAVLLTQPQKKNLQEMLSRSFDTPINSLQIKQNKEIVFGFQIKVGHLTIDWNIKTYFDDLNKQLEQKTAHIIEEQSL